MDNITYHGFQYDTEDTIIGVFIVFIFLCCLFCCCVGNNKFAKI